MNESKIHASPKVCTFLEKEKTPLELCYEPTYNMQNHSAITFNNVCSITNKWSALKNNKNIINSDIIIFAETWLSARQPASAFQLPNFQEVCMDSEHHIGYCGMLLYYKESCCHVSTQTYQSQHVEVIKVQLCSGPTTWQIYALYKPPQTSTTTLFSELDQSIECEFMDEPMLILGDFNIQMTEPAGHRFCHKMLQKYNVTQLNTGPSTWDRTQIDAAFANSAACEVYSLMNTWSQHHTLVVKIPTLTQHSADCHEE